MTEMHRTASTRGRPLVAGLRHLVAAALTLAGVSLLPAADVEAAASAQCGGASWYALDGRRTANGEIMNSGRMTAAHRRLPFGSVVTVYNRRNGRSVTVRINDRGPFIRGRIIDVSRAAAKRLGMIGTGVASICMSRGTAVAMHDGKGAPQAKKRHAKRTAAQGRSVTSTQKRATRKHAATAKPYAVGKMGPEKVAKGKAKKPRQAGEQPSARKAADKA